MRSPLLPRAQTPPAELRRRRGGFLRLAVLVFVSWVGAVALLNALARCLP